LDGKKYYHGTHCDLIPLIKSQGLLVSRDGYCVVHSETFEPRDAIGERLAKCGVYLTDNIEDAYWYAYDASKGVGGRPELLEMAEPDWNKTCIVEVKLPESIVVGSDGYGAFMTEDQDIPPDYISKIYHPDDLREYREM